MSGLALTGRWAVILCAYLGVLTWTPAPESKAEEPQARNAAPAQSGAKEAEGLLKTKILPPLPAPGKPVMLDKRAAESASRERPPPTNRRLRARRDKAMEEDLRRDLRWAPELGLRGADLAPLIKAYETNFRLSLQVTAEADFEPTTLLSIRPDFGRLPIRSGNHSRIDSREAAILTRLSTKLRVYLTRAAPLNDMNKRPDPVVLREVMRTEMRGKKPEWLRPEVIPVLLQLLMHEDKPVRAMLVNLLAEIGGKRATVALAQRAIYDLAPEVREAALDALQQRPREYYRPVLLKGLTYPWAPVADHAAEALVALEDRDSIPQLIGMLDKPDPGVPFPAASNRLVVREVVCFRHATNCLVCHPPSVTAVEPVPGVVPGVTLGGTANVNVSTTTPGPRYPYGSSSNASVATETPLLIRADVTYLRQDFSVAQALSAVPGTSLSDDFRFDYLVRVRTVSEKAASQLRNVPGKGEPSEQRQALLFALRHLTGVDKGTTFADWKPLLPETDVNREADKLVQELLKLHRVRQADLIAKYRDRKGVVYSEALARAIPRLAEDLRDYARYALAERMLRMTPATLQDKLEDESSETRLAALSASISKEAKSLVPQIIPLLEDTEPAVARLAHRALKELTEQDFGPRAQAEGDDVTIAAIAWRNWWKKQATAQQSAARNP
ncbi:MAG TPA: HEAT repeat domain-containing protein [Gemmataceae bacterium]|jgi:HEAT repeat protein|nr:HEAT repeat domain-containing protein [Gemmataceae bacterium]